MLRLLCYSLFFVICLLFTSSLGALSDVFNVATGNVPGSCDLFSRHINDNFEEALAMGKAGALAVQRARKGTLSFQGRRMLAVMFGIVVESSTAKLDEDTLSSLGTVETVFRATQHTELLKSLNADFFCGGDIMTWTTKIIDPDNNKATDRPITDVLPNAINGAYWFPAKKAYVEDRPPPGGEGDNPCSSWGGFVNRKHNLVVVCYAGLRKSGWRNTLTDVKADQGLIHPGDNLYAEYKSVSGAILHELSHLVSKAVNDQPAIDENGDPEVPPASSYGFMSCLLLGDLLPAKALLNADTYHIFGLAMYLNKWDWAGGVAQDPANI